MTNDVIPNNDRRRLLLLSTLAIGFVVPTVQAQETTALQTALTLEKTLVDAVAAAEQSVVAIARVRRRLPTTEFPGTDNLRRLLPRSDGMLSDPTDPDFIPNEYGSGVVIDSNGLILTNYHVLGDTDQGVQALQNENSYFVTTADRKVYRAQRIKAADAWSDLAVLEVAATGLHPIKFGDASDLKKGQFVIALGNPYAIARDGQASAGWGIISNLSRKAAPAPSLPAASGRETIHHHGTLIQTDARLRLGTSGGALLNLRGEMIGLTTSLAAVTASDDGAGFAIAVDAGFRRIVETLQAGREVEYGFLGVGPENLPLFERQSGRQGVRVGQLVSATPADQADIRTGDIITHVNGRTIHDADGLMLSVGREPIDRPLRLTVLRDGRELEKRVVLSKKFVWSTRPSIVTERDPMWRGIRVEYPTALADFKDFSDQGVVDRLGCVAIVEVTRDSSAWREGLRTGMFISHVGDGRVATPPQFRTRVAELGQGGVAVRLTSAVNGQVLRTIQPE